MEKLIFTKNSENAPVSCILFGEDKNTMNMILSKPDMNNYTGWISQLHPEIIGHTFTVLNPMIVDIGKVEAKHHDIFTNNRTKFSIDDYCVDTLVEILDVLDYTLDSHKQIEQITGETCGIEFVDMESQVKMHLHSGRTIESFAVENKIDMFVFKFHHKDTEIYRESVGYAIYDCIDASVKAFYSPEDFTNLDEGRYAYVGDVHPYGCIEYDCITNESCECILKEILKYFNEQTTPAWNAKIDSILS